MRRLSSPRRGAIFILFLAGCGFWVATCRAQSTPRFTISTLAGNGTSGFSGDGGAATSAELFDPDGVAVDPSGAVYIADTQNQRVRKVVGGIITTVAGSGTTGFSGDGSKATSADIADPESVALDSAGNLYIADSDNSLIRMVSNGNISTIAGNENAGGGYSGDFGPATSAQLFHPSGIAIDAYNNLFIADTSNNIVRVVKNGIITTAAGNGVKGRAGDGGLAGDAQLNTPVGVAVDSAGNLYIADSANNRVRKVSADTGKISTLAGNGTAGYSGDGGKAITAQLNNPQGVAVDAAGNVYIADEFNERIRVVTPDGNISTVAGGAGGFGGDGGPATSAELFFPTGVAVDAAGNVYVADRQNNRIRMLTAIPQPPVVNAGGVAGASAFGAFAAASPGSWIEIYGSNLAIDSRPWAGTDFNGVNAPTSLDGTSVSIGGQAAFVSYISSGQVDVQVPSATPTGSQPLVVTTKNGSSAAYSLTVNATEPGLLAPSNFNIGGNQYVAAALPDGATYALPAGGIAGVNSRPVFPGETVTLYGVGFGPVTPATPAGQIAQQSSTLALPFQVFFGPAAATVSYSGLAPGEVGLYQFNVVVPQIGASNLVPLTFTVNGVAGSQTLYIAVQN